MCEQHQHQLGAGDGQRIGGQGAEVEVPPPGQRRPQRRPLRRARSRRPRCAGGAKPAASQRPTESATAPSARGRKVAGGLGQSGMSGVDHGPAPPSGAAPSRRRRGRGGAPLPARSGTGEADGEERHAQEISTPPTARSTQRIRVGRETAGSGSELSIQCLDRGELSAAMADPPLRRADSALRCSTCLEHASAARPSCAPSRFGLCHLAVLTPPRSRHLSPLRLEEREEDDVADRRRVGEEHRQPVDPDPLPRRWAASRAPGRGCSPRRSPSSRSPRAASPPPAPRSAPAGPGGRSAR